MSGRRDEICAERRAIEKKRLFTEVTEMISRFMTEDIHTRTGIEMMHEVEDIFEIRKEEIWS